MYNSAWKYVEQRGNNILYIRIININIIYFDVYNSTFAQKITLEEKRIAKELQ